MPLREPVNLRPNAQCSLRQATVGPPSRGSFLRDLDMFVRRRKKQSLAVPLGDNRRHNLAHVARPRLLAHVGQFHSTTAHETGRAVAVHRAVVRYAVAVVLNNKRYDFSLAVYDGPRPVLIAALF